MTLMAANAAPPRAPAASRTPLAAKARLVVRRATISDVYAVARRLRPGDRAEIDAFGKDPRVVLRQSFRGSLICRTLLLDGAPAAIGGIAADILSDVGELWLMTTDLVERAPLAFVRAAQAELAAARKMRRRLEGTVLSDYAQAVRLLALLGFTLDAPAPLGRKGVLFRRFWIEV